MPISAYMLRTDSTLLLEQIRTIDKCRLKGYLGSISSQQMQSIDHALKLSIGLIPPGPARKKNSRRNLLKTASPVFAASGRLVNL